MLHVGYALLGPMARRKGWAPGPISNLETGAAGWVLWVSLAIMLGDSVTSLGLVTLQGVKSNLRDFWSRQPGQRGREEGWEESVEEGRSEEGGYGNAEGQGGEEEFESDEETGGQQQQQQQQGTVVEDNDQHQRQHMSTLTKGFRGSREDGLGYSGKPSATKTGRSSSSGSSSSNVDIPTSWWVCGLAASWVLCGVILTPLLNLPWYEPPVALLLALLVALLAVRALGQTDLNPVSGVGKLSQVGRGGGGGQGVCG